jgi:hypothetical protein
MCASRKVVFQFEQFREHSLQKGVLDENNPRFYYLSMQGGKRPFPRLFVAPLLPRNKP